METLLLNTKRKKRKTRKCLDELRKRSRSSPTKGEVMKKKGSNLCEISNVRKSSNCITSNRLTLTMFTKAVRSETIIRPSVSDVKKSPTSIVNPKTPVISPLILVETKSENSTPQISEESDITRQNESINFQEFHENNSSDNMISFSPLQREESHASSESSNQRTITTATSSNRSVEENGYHLYEELIEDIPLYLSRNFPHLIKDDVMNKAKSSLQNIYFENLQKQYESQENRGDCMTHNFMTSDRSCTSKETIVQNPMEYIKAGWHQSFQQAYHESSLSNEDMSPTLSPNSLCSPVTSAQIHSVLAYTPDYEYFPHRLN